MSEQAVIAHPDAALERRHLKQTLEEIAAETSLLERTTSQQAQDVEDKRMEAGGIYSDELLVAELVYEHKAQTLHQLRLAASRPYFTRVDFIPDGEREKRTYYIGKWGVLRAATLTQVVVDWRAPVANLYYSGQVGRMHYAAPDGEVRGELTLKRQLGVEDGTLRTIFDTDVVSQDAYLQGVLGAVSSDRLREVVSTIQAEQNIVIRYKPDRPLIVQGVAGSGKTTIALHRIAYLLYAYQDQMQPRNMMILAPNPLFLDYISAVLPDLGVEQVVQTTFPMLVARWLGKQMPKVQETHRLEDMLAMDAQARDAKAATLRFQGSLRFGRLLQAFLTDLEKHVVPEGDVMFGPATLYTHAQMQQIFQVELQPFPIKQRMAEIPKYIKRRLRQAQAQVLHWLETECAKRAEALADAMPDGPERRERMTRLYDSRDARCKETEARAKTFTKDYLSQWPTLDLLEVYRAFWSLLWPAELEEAERTLFEALAAQTLPLLEKKRISTGDMAPLAFLQRFIGGISRMDIRHSVIDEAQDFSPLQFQLLREVMGNPSFTIVGDLMQGVHAYEGLHAWQEILQPVFGEDAQMHFLRTSYRNTVEIMHFASRVPICHPVPGQMLARPVLRHGPEPELIACVSTKERNERVAAQTAALLAEGFHTIAILAKREEDCKAMFRALPASLSARLLRAEDSSYQGGVLVMSAVLVKGLEFDAVIMADVGEAQFADELLDARLLYVCLTRPLHRLTCYYLGACTKLLSQAEGSKPAAES